jgi:hypothetical protein
MRRWVRRGIIATHFVEWQSKPVNSELKTWQDRHRMLTPAERNSAAIHASPARLAPALPVAEVNAAAYGVASAASHRFPLPRKQ